LAVDVVLLALAGRHRALGLGAEALECLACALDGFLRVIDGGA
jgi:hypothetical protein